MKTEVEKVFTPEKCKTNEKKLYVFGENETQQFSKTPGGGQAFIRGEHNSFGFCTLRAIGVFWSDDNYSKNLVTIERDIQSLKTRLEYYDAVIFPYSGLGTGRACMQRNCPKTFLYLTKRLLEEFKFNNIENLISEPF